MFQYKAGNGELETSAAANQEAINNAAKKTTYRWLDSGNALCTEPGPRDCSLLSDGFVLLNARTASIIERIESFDQLMHTYRVVADRTRDLLLFVLELHVFCSAYAPLTL